MKSLFGIIVTFCTLHATALPNSGVQAAVGSRAACNPLAVSWAPQSGNLLHLWHLDHADGAATTPDSVGANTATSSSTAASVADHIGARSYETLPLSAGLMTSTAVTNPQTFTYTAWFKTSTTIGGMIMGFGNSTAEVPGSYDRLLGMNASGQILFGIYDGSTQVITSPGSYNNGQWHHVAATSNNGTITIFVDGSLVVTNTYGAAQGYTGYFRIGGSYAAGWPGYVGSVFDGVLDEVGIWSVVLSNSEIAALAAAPAAVNSSHPQWANTYGIYHLDETSGNYADASGHSNTATPLRQRGRSVAGLYSNGLQNISRAGGYLSTATQYNNPQTFSLMAWFKTTATNGGMIIQFGNAQTGDSGNYDRLIGIEDNGYLVFGINDNGASGLNVLRSPSAVNDGKWHHVVGTFTSGSQVLYIDGQPVGSATPNHAENFFGYWRLGDGKFVSWPISSTQGGWSGYLDEIAIWSTVLTANQVRTIFLGQRCGIN